MINCICENTHNSNHTRILFMFFDFLGNLCDSSNPLVAFPALEVLHGQRDGINLAKGRLRCRSLLPSLGGLAAAVGPRQEEN